MALRQKYTAQTDIPDALREHYGEQEGSWVLLTDPPFEDVTGLKTALGQERNLRRDAEKLYGELKTRFEGIDPDEVGRLRERVKGLDDAEVYDKQGIEALVARRTETMKAEHERQVKVKDGEIGKLRSTLETTTHQWRQDRIRTALLNAVSGSGVDADAVEDAIHRGLQVFSDIDDDGNVVAKKGEEVLYGKDGVHPLSPSEWIGELKTSGRARHLWPASSGGGAPAYHGSNGAQIDWAALPPAERLTRYREMQTQQRR